MRTEREKMLAGDLYDPTDAELVEGRRAARVLTGRFNLTSEDDRGERKEIVRALFGAAGKGVWVEPPFRCDYGTNISLGDGVYFNFDCVILDCAEVRIGHRVLFGPGAHIYTATHPIRADERARGLEMAKPVEIGDDAWIGGRAIILPGVRIGAGAVVAAGSVVTRDVPPHTLVAGNPARILRAID